MKAWEIWNTYDQNLDNFTRVVVINENPLETLSMIQTEDGWEIETDHSLFLQKSQFCLKVDELQEDEILPVIRAYLKDKISNH